MVESKAVNTPPPTPKKLNWKNVLKLLTITLITLILISMAHYLGWSAGYRSNQIKINKLEAKVILLEKTLINFQTDPRDVPEQSDSNLIKPSTIPTLTQKTYPNPTQRHTNLVSANYTDQIIKALNAGEVIKKVNRPSFSLPSNINEAQILNYFQLGNLYFALVMQNSMNVNLDTPNDYKITFTGILASEQGKSQWIPITEIQDKQSNSSSTGNNPYYLWTNSNRLLLSVIDQNGAGSGEGTMKVFKFSDDGSWKLSGCYYFGSYDSDNYFASSSQLSNYTPKPLAECEDVIINP